MVVCTRSSLVFFVVLHIGTCTQISHCVSVPGLFFVRVFVLRPGPLAVVAARLGTATCEGAHHSQRRTTPDPGLAHAPTKAM